MQIQNLLYDSSSAKRLRMEIGMNYRIRIIEFVSHTLLISHTVTLCTVSAAAFILCPSFPVFFHA